MNDEMIDLACSGLLSSVKRYLRNYEKRALKYLSSVSSSSSPEEEVSIQKDEITHIVNHACFVLQELSKKRKSFQNGVKAIFQLWKTEWFPFLLQQQHLVDDGDFTTFQATIQSMLSHLFQHYLRLRDGTVLMTSGECRHPGDVHLAQKKKNNKAKNNANFVSRLSSLSTCEDGYTKVYSSAQGYSGFGWDEFFNETVGIQKRLIQRLALYARKKSSTVWDSLLDHGGQTFESALDTHDMEVTQLRQELDSFKSRVEKDIKLLLHKYAAGGSIKMVTQDKMERMDVTIYHTGTASSMSQSGAAASSKSSSGNSKISEIRLERLASNFMVQDPKGVLPDGWTFREWKQDMTFIAPKLLTKKTKSARIASFSDNTPCTTSSLQQISCRENIRKSQIAAARKRRVIEDSSSSEDENDDDGGNDYNAHNKKLKYHMKEWSKDSLSESTQQSQKSQQSQNSQQPKQEQQQQQGGLRVRVKQKSNQLPSPSNGNSMKSYGNDNDGNASLTAIKTHFGVNAAELEASREELEAEEEKTGNAITTTASNESSAVHGLSAEQQQAHRLYHEELRQQKCKISQLQATVQHRRQNLVARQGKTMKVSASDAVNNKSTATAAQVADDYEIWDAREYLRESLMILGNLFLSLHNTIKTEANQINSVMKWDDKGDSKYHNGHYLQEAEILFREACEIVQQQEKTHHHSSKMTNDETSAESTRIKRRLLLLAGRSRTNLGISLIERALSEKEQSKKKSSRITDEVLLLRKNVTPFANLMDKGIKELELGRSKASAMRAKAVIDKPQTSSKCGAATSCIHEETAMDLLEADELYCLASRWLGNALWYKGNHEQDSIQVYEDAAKLFVDESRYFLNGDHPQLIEAEFSLGMEAFYCSSTLAELAMEALETLPSLSKFESRGNGLLSIALRGYELAEMTVRKMKRMTQHPNSPWTMDDLVETRELATAEQISSLALDLKLWWNRQKGTLTIVDKNTPLVTPLATNSKLSRNDLSVTQFPSGQQQPDPYQAPRKSFIITGRPSRRLNNTALTRRGQKEVASSENIFDNFEDIGNAGSAWSDIQRTKKREKPVCFRKWGDELLSQNPSGKAQAQCFPSVAPTRPGVSVQ